MSDNYYDILEITPQSSIDEIKRAYHQHSLKYHPDKIHHIDESSSISLDMMKMRYHAIQEAYQVLSNEESKKKYDNELNSMFHPCHTIPSLMLIYAFKLTPPLGRLSVRYIQNGIFFQNPV